MIPTHGLVAEFREAAGAGDDRSERWTAIRQEIVQLKGELDRGNRPGIAHELAELVFEAYSTAIAHDIRLDSAIRQIHRSRMSDFGSRPYTPNMWRAIAPIEPVVVRDGNDDAA